MKWGSSCYLNDGIFCPTCTEFKLPKEVKTGKCAKDKTDIVAVSSEALSAYFSRPHVYKSIRHAGILFGVGEVFENIGRTTGELWEEKTQPFTQELEKEYFSKWDKILHAAAQEGKCEITDFMRYFRVAITGKLTGFGIYQTILILGRNSVINRLVYTLKTFAPKLFQEIDGDYALTSDVVETHSLHDNVSTSRPTTTAIKFKTDKRFLQLNGLPEEKPPYTAIERIEPPAVMSKPTDPRIWQRPGLPEDNLWEMMGITQSKENEVLVFIDKQTLPLDAKDMIEMKGWVEKYCKTLSEFWRLCPRMNWLMWVLSNAGFRGEIWRKIACRSIRDEIWPFLYYNEEGIIGGKVDDKDTPTLEQIGDNYCVPTMSRLLVHDVEKHLARNGDALDWEENIVSKYNTWDLLTGIYWNVYNFATNACLSMASGTPFSASRRSFKNIQSAVGLLAVINYLGITPKIKECPNWGSVENHKIYDRAAAACEQRQMVLIREMIAWK